MQVDDFRYELPPGLVAQEPAQPRDAARLLVHELRAGRTRHRVMADLPDELRPTDLLVVNDTRVLPARLFARRPSGGRVELLFVAPAEGGRWRAMVRPARRLRAGEELAVQGGARGGLVARAVAREGTSAFWSLELVDPRAPGRSVPQLLEDAGRMPLPPYIARDPQGDRRDASDRERYQTIFAREAGAVAAPTAGLHFTPALLAALETAGVARAALTLHVGLGTFLPVSAARVEEHEMHAERYVVPAGTATAVAACRRRGGRVIAVGTTSVRALESCAGPQGDVCAGEGETRLFLKPGDRLRVVDGLLTNFHLPGSTLLMLVSAFAGRERVLELYAEAIAREYRFYSYGDAMLLLP